MRPTTPNFNFAQSVNVGPSSPPATPTSSSFTFKNRRPTNFSRPLSVMNGIIPDGTGPHFSYHRPDNLSPRSTSPSSESDSEDGSASPPRSLQENDSDSASPLSSPRREKFVEGGDFTIEEITESDLEDYEFGGDEFIIRPHQYEDAEELSSSHIPKPTANTTKTKQELDPTILRNLRDLEPFLDIADEEEPEYEQGEGKEGIEEHEEWVRRNREEKRRRRRSSACVPKRTLAESIGSDTDDADLQADSSWLGANEAGSSARRLRRKVGEGDVGGAGGGGGDLGQGADRKRNRMSLIFDDPPIMRILEEEEPDSCEEIVEDDIDHVGDGGGIGRDGNELRELPYYVLQEDMDLDSN